MEFAVAFPRGGSLEPHRHVLTGTYELTNGVALSHKGI